MGLSSLLQFVFSIRGTLKFVKICAWNETTSRRAPYVVPFGTLIARNLFQLPLFQSMPCWNLHQTLAAGNHDHLDLHRCLPSLSFLSLTPEYSDHGWNCDVKKGKGPLCLLGSRPFPRWQERKRQIDYWKDPSVQAVCRRQCCFKDVRAKIFLRWDFLHFSPRASS